MTNEEFQSSQNFEENLKEWNLLSLEEMGESVKEGSLYVIGNGFDMLHGVRSSYYDFSRKNKYGPVLSGKISENR